MIEILIATANKHKVDEYKQMLSPYGYQVKSLLDLNFENIEETGTTFAQNALIKATALHKLTNLLVLADDSGLQIKALNNEPGIYSARYLGVDTPYHQKNEIIIDRLAKVIDRSAKFVCAIAIVDKDDQQVFIGEFDGEIAYQQLGEHGFGYDPIFYLKEYGLTAAQLDPKLKNKISHRAKALQQALAYLKKKGD